VFNHYGLRLRRFGMDKTGNGLPLWQFLRDDPDIEQRLAGYNFSEKKPIDFEDRAPIGNEVAEDLVIKQNIVDYTTDRLREIVDTQCIELPYDTDLLTEFQGQAIARQADMGSAGGISTGRRYTGGRCHTLDAARMMIAAKTLQKIEATLSRPPDRGPILEVFMA